MLEKFTVRIMFQFIWCLSCSLRELLSNWALICTKYWKLNHICKIIPFLEYNFSFLEMTNLLSAWFRTQSINIWTVKDLNIKPQKYHIYFHRTLYIKSANGLQMRLTHGKPPGSPVNAIPDPDTQFSHQDGCEGGPYIKTAARCYRGVGAINHVSLPRDPPKPGVGAPYLSFRRHLIIDILLNGY